MSFPNIHWSLLGLISVVLVVLSFPPYPLGVVMLVGFVPFFIAIDTAPTWKSAFVRAWIIAFVGNSIICYWIAHTMHEFAGLPWSLSIPAVFLLSAVEQITWPIMAAGRHLVHKHLGIRPLFWTPLFMLVLEFCWPKLWSNTVGVVFYGNEWLRQVADITGVWGLTALVIATNECIAMLLLKRWPKKELRRHALATTVVLLLAVSYGMFRHGQMQDYIASPEDTLRVALIQPNFNSVARVIKSADREQTRIAIVDELVTQSEETLAAKPDLLFWPETVVPAPYHSDSAWERVHLTRELDRFVSRTGVPLMFGARHYRQTDYYNSLYLARPKAGQIDIQRYDKNILLLLGEYIPLADSFPGWRRFLLDRGAAIYSRGDGPTLMQHSKARLGPMICYEGLFPTYVRTIVNQGAQLLVNATNDSWYGATTEPDLHLALTVFRSIETRRPLVRVTNTGYTAVADIDGSVRVKSEMNQRASIIHDVPVYAEIDSPYLLVGNLLILLAAVWVGGRIFWSVYRTRALNRAG